MPNLHLQIHLVFIPMTSRVRIWDFRLRPPAHRGYRGLRPGGISDLWNRFAQSFFIKWAEYITSIFDIYPPPEDSLLQSFIFKLIDHSVGSGGAEHLTPDT
jgi:hypothetical protein